MRQQKSSQLKVHGFHFGFALHRIFETSDNAFFFFFFFFHVTLFPLFTDSYVKQTHIQLGEFFITFVPSLRSKRSQSSLFFFF